MNLSHVAIVGLGSIGARHLRLLRELRPDLKIALVRSGFGARVEDQELANNVVSSIAEAVHLGVEAAIIASPATCHVVQAQEFLKSNIPLLIEKPLSKDSESLEDLLGLYTKSEVPVLIGYVLRYRPDTLKFKSLISSSDIGKIHSVFIESASYLPEWRPKSDYRKSVSANKDLGGGVLLELSHELDYMNYFFGHCTCVSSIIRRTGLLEIDVEDQVIASFVSERNVLVSMTLDFARKVSSRKISVMTDKGQLSWDLLEKSITSTIEGVPSISEFKFDYDDPYRNQIKHFISCIEDGETELISLHDGMEVMKLIDQVKEVGMYLPSVMP